mgnify:CR=1 FL=1
MNRKKTLPIIVLVIAFLITVPIIGKKISLSHNSTPKNMAGFTEISAVNGVSFYINSQFIERATAVSEISDSINFEKNQFYSYTDGSEKYLLFNMSSLLIAAQKGTKFNMDTDDKLQALQSADLANIWFDQGSKEFDCKSGNGSYLIKANASVSINRTTYGDFCGELMILSKDGEEWSLFVGVPGSQYEKLKNTSQDGIDKIVKTFSFDDSTTADKAVYAVTISGNGDREEVKTQQVTKQDKSSLNLSNQKEIVNKSGEMAYTSSPYNMLSLGDNGILSIFNDVSTKYEDAIICPKAIYRGTDAESIIKDFCQTTKQYDYSPCENGYTWEVIEYDLNYAYCDNVQDGYVNLKVCGVDGNKLKYNDNQISGRTYDMTYKAKQDGNWIRGYYSYYAIPDGCTQYCIMAGESKSVTDEEVRAAYYWVTEQDTTVDEPKPQVLQPESTQEEIKKEEVEPKETDETDTKTSGDEEKNEEENKQEITKVTKKTAPKKSNKSTAPAQETPAPAPQPQPQPQPQPEDNGVIVPDGYTTLE